MRKILRCFLWAILLSTAGCASDNVGVGLSVAVPTQWGSVSVGTSTGGWYGSPWYR